MLKNIIKKLLSEKTINLLHSLLTSFGAFLYGYPSEKLIVIGVTGTNGKTTTCNLIAHILMSAGEKVALATTVNFRVDNKEWLNDQKMTMLGRFKLQKLLAQAVKSKCHFAVIETSSQGLIQGRHLGLNYDLVVFTNLTPEHIEAHGGFENYKQAKAMLFKYLSTKPTKNLFGHTWPKTIVSNTDDQNGLFYLGFPAEKRISYALDKIAEYSASKIALSANNSQFYVDKLNTTFSCQLPGRVNIYNALAAIAGCKNLNISTDNIVSALKNFQLTPGRFELINEGQNFQVMVDYAPEPESLKHLYETLELFHYHNLIHVLGSCGGGRDMARRPILGKMAAENADYIIITNEDPYDDDPQEIIDQVAAEAKENLNFSESRLFKIMDRGAAIKKAIDLAQANDLVLITGKGAEQFICGPHGSKIPWDDRQIARLAIKEKLAKKNPA